MALASTRQDVWSGGIHRQRDAPADAYWDAVNCLLNDQGRLYRRGGSAYWSGSDAGNTLTRLAALYYPGLAASRVTAAGNGHFYAFNGTTPVDISASLFAAAAVIGRPASVNGIGVFPLGPGRVALYAGSLKTATYSTGTLSTTAGSNAVTGSGTSWSANVDSGMLMQHIGSGRTYVVRSVTSNTALTTTGPIATTVAGSGNYTFWPILDTATGGFFDLPPIGTATYVTAAGSGTPRLIATIGNRAYITVSTAEAALSLNFNNSTNTTTYQELPSNAEITGAEGIGDSCWLFSSAGVWRVDNLSLDPVDAFGNQTQTVQRISEDLILWGDRGIVSWGGAVVVPSTDDVRLLAPDGSGVTVTGTEDRGRVRDLYRSYVATAGYHPGRAAVFKGHYYLPIVDSSDVVQDVLVCRLDRQALPWTRWSGHAASGAFTVLPQTSSTAPKLLGLASQRVTDLTGTLAPVAGNSQDADATNFDAVITTRDYPLGASQPGFCQRARLTYELSGDGVHTAPTVALAYSSDQDAGVFTTITENGLQGGGTAGAVSDGSKYSFWIVGKRRPKIRFRITMSGSAASFILRSIELLTRPQGRQ